MNRTEHLQQTLLQNILDNPPSAGVEVEFVIMDYNDKSGLKDWLFSNPMLIEYLKNGTIRYAGTTEPEVYCGTHARNMAQRVATGDFVCVLDADNFLGKNFVGILADVFRKDPNAFVAPSRPFVRSLPVDEWGCDGRIALSKENFFRLGGYDERIRSYGGADLQLIRRAIYYGLRHHEIADKRYLSVIPHSDEARLHYYYRDDEMRQVAVARIRSYRGQNSSQRAWRRIKEAVTQHMQVNRDGRYGLGHVQVWTGSDFKSVELLPVVGWSMSKYHICALGASRMAYKKLCPTIIAP
jgi:hypothetical protein